MTHRTKCTCQLVVGIAGAVMGVVAWATAGHMALLGNWLPASIRRHIQGLMDTVIGNFASVIDLNETLHEETGLWVIEPEQYKRRVNR